jgi:hypothetical protein
MPIEAGSLVPRMPRQQAVIRGVAVSQGPFFSFRTRVAGSKQRKGGEKKAGFARCGFPVESARASLTGSVSAALLTIFSDFRIDQRARF